jgi:anti-anti-sigma factor
VDATELEPGTRVALRGRLDAAGLPDARAALHGALRGGRGDLVVDLADVEVRDAAGLGMLLNAHRAARRGGRRLVLTGVPPAVDRMLRATRLHLVLNVEPPAEVRLPERAAVTL